MIDLPSAVRPESLIEQPPPETLQFFGGIAGGFGARAMFWAPKQAPVAEHFPFFTQLSAFAGSLGAAPASPSFVGATAFQGGTEGDSDGIPSGTITLPGGIQSGDIVIVACTVVNNGDREWSAPAGEGWTQFAGDEHDTSGTRIRMQMFWKRWGAGGQTDDATPTFTFSGSGIGTGAAIVGSVWRGCVASGSPFDTGTFFSQTGAAVTTLTAPSATSSGLKRTVLRFFTAKDTNADGTNGLTGFSGGTTSAYSGPSYATSAASFDGFASVCGYTPNVSAGSTGTATVGGADGPGTTYVAISIVLVPDTSDSVTPTIGTPATNDIVFAIVHRVGTGNSVTAPAGQGWAAVNGLLVTTNVDTRLDILWKRWGSGATDDTTPTFTITDKNNTPWGVTLVVFRRCRTTGNPWEDTDITSGTGLTATAPSSDSAGDQRTSFRVFLIQGTSGFGAVSSDEDPVYQGAFYGNGNGSIAASTVMRMSENIGAGATGTATASGPSGSDNWIACTVVLRGTN